MRALAALCVLAVAPVALANGKDAASVIVVVGAAGGDEYGARFRSWGERWRGACARGGARFLAIGLDGPAGSDRKRLEEAVAREVRSGAGPLWLVLIGHGTFDGRTARFNLRGPDVSAPELAAWLAPSRRPLVFVDTAPASAPFIKALAGPDRVIVTATKTGQEQNATRFGGFFAEAFADARADLDKDGQTSVLEAFLTAARQVEASYAETGLIATEHPLLDDNGDGLGIAASFFKGLRLAEKPAGDAVPDGRRAHQLHLIPSDPERAIPDDLRRRRDELERQVLALRDGRPKLADADYYARLEPLLVELARIYERAARR